MIIKKVSKWIDVNIKTLRMIQRVKKKSKSWESSLNYLLPANPAHLPHFLGAGAELVGLFGW